MRHQELHLVGQDAAVAQDEVFPQAGHVGGIQQGHVGLLRRAAALAMVAGPAISPPSRSYQLNSPVRKDGFKDIAKMPAPQASYPRLLVYDLRTCLPLSPLMP